MTPAIFGHWQRIWKTIYNKSLHQTGDQPGWFASLNQSLWRQLVRRLVGHNRMKQYKSHWWSLSLPDDWEAEPGDPCTTFLSPSRLGALQISAGRNLHGPATDDDLREFAAEDLERGGRPRRVKCGDFTGFHICPAGDDTYQHQWWLQAGDIVLLATYTWDSGQPTDEPEAVDEILNTLAVED